MGCSVLELRARTDKADLMAEAFAYRSGTADGEFLLKLNPTYQRKRKEMAAQIEAAEK